MIIKEKKTLLIDSFQVVQEYERAVMFRLGRILGGAKVCSLNEESHHYKY